MAVSQQTTANSSTGNGVTTVFPYAFKILAAADLEVAVDGVVKTLNVDYTVSGAGDAAGGNVTFTIAPAALTLVTRRRNMALTRSTDYQYQGDLPNDVLNADQDAPVLMIQQLAEQVGRGLKLPVGDAATALLPAAAERAGKVLAFDIEGNIALTSFAGGADGALVSHIQPGLLARSRSMQTVVREMGASIVGYSSGDPTGVLNARPAVEAAMADSYRVIVPDGTFFMDDAPNYGTGSYYFEIDPNADFTGPGAAIGKFPYMVTNEAQMAVGPYIRCQSSRRSAHPNGGIAALSVEMLQPSDYGAGQSVAIYAGARATAADPSANTWAINCLIAVQATALGTHQCIEVDVDTNSAAATCKGISISGGGSANPDVALEFTRLPGSRWDRGLHVLRSQDAIVVDQFAGGRALVIDSEGARVAAMVNSGISIRQNANSADCIFVQANTSTGPGGFVLRAVNADNSANVLLMDVLGNITGAGIVAGQYLSASGGAPASSNAGEVRFSGAVVTTVGAGGGAAAMPTPRGYIQIHENGLAGRIAVFN